MVVLAVLPGLQRVGLLDGVRLADVEVALRGRREVLVELVQPAQVGLAVGGLLGALYKETRLEGRSQPRESDIRK